MSYHLEIGTLFSLSKSRKSSIFVTRYLHYQYQYRYSLFNKLSYFFSGSITYFDQLLIFIKTSQNRKSPVAATLAAIVH